MEGFFHIICKLKCVKLFTKAQKILQDFQVSHRSILIDHLLYIVQNSFLGEHAPRGSEVHPPNLTKSCGETVIWLHKSYYCINVLFVINIYTLKNVIILNNSLSGGFQLMSICLNICRSQESVEVKSTGCLCLFCAV